MTTTLTCNAHGTVQGPSPTRVQRAGEAIGDLWSLLDAGTNSYARPERSRMDAHGGNANPKHSLPARPSVPVSTPPASITMRDEGQITAYVSRRPHANANANASTSHQHAHFAEKCSRASEGTTASVDAVR